MREREKEREKERKREKERERERKRELPLTRSNPFTGSAVVILFPLPNMCHSNYLPPVVLS